MSFKLLRGKIARQILKQLTNTQIKTKHVALVKKISRSLSTQTAPVLEPNVLVSPYGKIEVGKETLTDYVFKDFKEWPNAPCVVS